MIRQLVKIRERGFTLVELLTVIAIISILAGMVMVNVNSARVKARDDKRKIDIDTVSQSLELYYAQNKRYPANPGMIFHPSTWATLRSALSGYISSWPTDPGRYIYVTDTNNKKYVADAKLEKKPSGVVVGSCDPGQASFWQSGDFDCGDGTYHYRRAGR